MTHFMAFVAASSRSSNLWEVVDDNALALVIIGGCPIWDGLGHRCRGILWGRTKRSVWDIWERFTSLGWVGSVSFGALKMDGSVRLGPRLSGLLEPLNIPSNLIRMLKGGYISKVQFSLDDII